MVSAIASLLRLIYRTPLSRALLTTDTYAYIVSVQRTDIQGRIILWGHVHVGINCYHTNPLSVSVWKCSANCESLNCEQLMMALVMATVRWVLGDFTQIRPLIPTAHSNPLKCCSSSCFSLLEGASILYKSQPLNQQLVFSYRSTQKLNYFKMISFDVSVD